MNKQQVIDYFNLYLEIKNKQNKIKELLDIIDEDNYNGTCVLTTVFEKLTKILIPDKELLDILEYLIYETGLGSNKLVGGQNYYIEIKDGKRYELTNIDDCITYLIEENYITN